MNHHLPAIGVIIPGIRSHRRWQVRLGMRDTTKVQILQIRVCRRSLLGCASDRCPHLARLAQELSLLPPRRLSFLVFLDLLELASTVSFEFLGG